MNVLVVTTVAGVENVLAGEISDRDTVKVVVPAVDQSLVDWLANDQEAYSKAEEVAAQSADRLPGEVDSAEVGEADLELAVRDALATFPADEIILAVRRGEQRGGIGATAVRAAPRGEIDGVPVRVVVLDRD
jgi:hypothetical protein